MRRLSNASRCPSASSWRSIGRRNASRNCFGLPSRPGAVRENIAHSSPRLFSIGVPVIAYVIGAPTPITAAKTLDEWFFAFWASSSSMPAHDWAAYSSASSRNSAYEVITMSA